MNREAGKFFPVSDASVRAGGTFVSYKNSDPDIVSISIDSRTVSSGGLFIALNGEITDGHKYISSAFESGASAAMISSKYYAKHYNNVSFFNGCLIVVEDTLSGFHKLAASWVADFGKLTRVAVTGSNGKSTTKEMIGSILAEDGSTVINKGNLNSETGLPLSVMGIKKEHKYGVFEMGINHPGEMKALVSVFSPQFALVTNIGTAHIGPMGSQEAIAAEKSEIFSLFDKDNTGFIPDNDSWADYMETHCPGKTIRYGLNSTEGIEKAFNLGLKGWNIQYKNLEINLKLVGQHNLNNAIASISLSSALGIIPDKIKKGLEKIEPLKGRSQIIEGLYTIIEDSYNANADSMKEIFQFISDLEWDGRVALVLGSMKELGDESVQMHRLVGTMAAELNPDVIFLFGLEMRDAYFAIQESDYSGQVVHILDYQKLENLVLDSLIEGDLVLLKGSRTMELNRLADEISKLMGVLGV